MLCAVVHAGAVLRSPIRRSFSGQDVYSGLRDTGELAEFQLALAVGSRRPGRLRPIHLCGKELQIREAGFGASQPLTMNRQF